MTGSHLVCALICSHLTQVGNLSQQIASEQMLQASITAHIEQLRGQLASRTAWNAQASVAQVTASQ
jgi:hypothetical protein